MTCLDLQAQTFASLELATRATVLLAAATGEACLALLPAAEAPASGVPLQGNYRVRTERDAVPGLAEGRWVALYRCRLYRPLPAAVAAEHVRRLTDGA